MWESPTLGSYVTSYEGFVAHAGDLVLFASDRELRAFSLTDGSPRWMAMLRTRIASLCDAGTDSIVALGADGEEHAIRARDGAPVQTEDATCTPLIRDYNVVSLEISGRTLLISRSGILEARDLDAGAARWQFGN